MLTIRAVQMNRVGTISVIDEAYHSFSALLHLEGRTWSLAIISDKASLAKIRIDLLFERFDVDLIVVNGRTILVVKGPCSISRYI